MFRSGSLGFGILTVVAPLVLHRAKCVEIPIFLSMALGMAPIMDYRSKSVYLLVASSQVGHAVSHPVSR